LAKFESCVALHPKLAPVKVAILPLVRKDGMPERAEKIHADLRKRHAVVYDESAAIGKRYRRQDEIGTPLCITVDGDTLKDNTVTVRERDSMQQVRVSESELGPLRRREARSPFGLILLVGLLARARDAIGVEPREQGVARHAEHARRLRLIPTRTAPAASRMRCFSTRPSSFFKCAAANGAGGATGAVIGGW